MESKEVNEVLRFESESSCSFSGALFLLVMMFYSFLFCSPIADIAWKGTGSLWNVSVSKPRHFWIHQNPPKLPCFIGCCMRMHKMTTTPCCQIFAHFVTSIFLTILFLWMNCLANQCLQLMLVTAFWYKMSQPAETMGDESWEEKSCWRDIKMRESSSGSSVVSFYPEICTVKNILRSCCWKSLYNSQLKRWMA